MANPPNLENIALLRGVNAYCKANDTRFKSCTLLQNGITVQHTNLYVGMDLESEFILVDSIV